MRGARQWRFAARGGRLPRAGVFMTFAAGSVIGYIAETLYCSLAAGEYQSRKGLLHGPFNQVYGVGAVLMSKVLTPLREQGGHALFLGSAVLGGAYEWACSWLQEMCYGKVSWDYTGKALSVGGRTSLRYMAFWGALGTAYITEIQDHIQHMLGRIPQDRYNAVCRVLAAVLAVDIVLSASALSRSVARKKGIGARNRYEQYVDVTYPDHRLAKIYPSMQPSPAVAKRVPEKMEVYS